MAGACVPKDQIKLEHPEVEEYGDYSTNIAMVMARDLKTSPVELAQKIAEKMDAKVAGPGFINVKLQSDYFVSVLDRVITQGQEYGRHAGGLETRLIEHTSPNPNKAMHLGHLRNNVTGMAIANIWEFLGKKVIRDCIDNNRGIAIAKLMWGYKKFAEGKTPEKLGLRPDRFVDELYSKANDEFERSEEVQKEVRQMVVDWEAEDKKTWDLWKKVLEYSYLGQKMTLERLGNRWDKVWHEHEHYREGKRFVEEGLKKGVFRRADNGTVLTDLADYNLPDTVVMKSDGTALYITQDLSLTRLKRDTFRPDRLFWVIGPEQSLALKQMFAVCEQLGIGKREDYEHVAYGYMSIKGHGKMSSRKGNVVYIDDLLDLARGKVEKLIADDREVEGEKKEEIAEKVGVGAVKYSILKVGRMQDMAFDMDESISMEGNSGPYLQYTYARARSVLAKSQETNPKKQTNFKFQESNYQFNSEEVAVLRWIYRFPEVVEEAGERLAPNLVCNYLFELAQRFNTFYNKDSILGSAKGKVLSAKEKETRDFRLAMTSAVGQVLKNGLGLLGIEALERM